MVDPAWAAVVTLIITSVAAPWLLSRQAAKTRASEKEADYARQDEVAARVEEAARLLKSTAKTTNEKLDGIHTIVDGTHTRLLQSVLDYVEISLLSLNEVVRLNRKLGVEPDADALGVIEATKVKIAELETELDGRLAVEKKVGA